MRVFVVIEPGNIGDMEAFGGVFATFEGADNYCRENYSDEHYDPATDEFIAAKFPGWFQHLEGSWTLDATTSAYPLRGTDFVIREVELGA